MLVPRSDLASRACVVLLVVAYLTSEAPSNYAKGRQAPLRQVREKEGLAVSIKAQRLNQQSYLSPDGKKLLSRITEAGERGDWQQVQKMFARYGGDEIPIFNAVMHIALNCTQVQAAARVYERLCDSNLKKT